MKIIDFEKLSSDPLNISLKMRLIKIKRDLKKINVNILNDTQLHQHFFHHFALFIIHRINIFSQCDFYRISIPRCVQQISIFQFV